MVLKMRTYVEWNIFNPSVMQRIYFKIDMNHTFPSFARENGSDAQETLPSVHFLLPGTTLTRLPKDVLWVASDVLLITGAGCLFDLSGSSKVELALLFLAGVWTLLSSLSSSFSLVLGFLWGTCNCIPEYQYQFLIKMVATS